MRSTVVTKLVWTSDQAASLDMFSFIIPLGDDPGAVKICWRINISPLA